MKSFISSDRNMYYEAPDRLNPADVEVPKRPTVDHILYNGSWVHPSMLQPQPASVNQPAPQVPQQNLSDLVATLKQLQAIQDDDFEEKRRTSGIFGDKFTWKDLITILYFAGGIVGLWMHVNERILILEHKVVSIEKGSAEMQQTFKEFIVKNENQLKTIDSKISDLQQMVITRLAEDSSPKRR